MNFDTAEPDYVPREVLKTILDDLPDLTEEQIAEVREEFTAEYNTTSAGGYRKSMRDMAIEHGVSLRSIAYAVIPGLAQDVRRSIAESGVQIDDSDEVAEQVGEEVYTTEEAARALRLSRECINKYINRGRIAVVKLDRSDRRYITQTALDEFAKWHKAYIANSNKFRWIEEPPGSEVDDPGGKVLNYTEAAEMLDCARGNIYNLVSLGYLTKSPYKVNGRSMVYLDSVIKYKSTRCRRFKKCRRRS